MGTILFGLHKAMQGLAGFIRWIAPALPLIALLALGAVLYHWTPFVGPRASQARLQGELVSALETIEILNADLEAKTFELDLSRGLRKAEALDAARALTEQSAQCRIDVAEARRSTLIIEKLIGDPKDEDPSHDGTRGLIDPDGLRDLLKGD